MNQEQFDSIVAQLTIPSEIQAMKMLWRKYQQLQGAVIYAQGPPIINIQLSKELADEQA